MYLVDGISKKSSNDFEYFDKAFPDGRFTEPSNGKVYRLREAIILSKKLGRPLNENEMKQFEVQKL